MARGDVVANTWRRARAPRARRFARPVEQARRPTATGPAWSVTSCAAAIRRPPRHRRDPRHDHPGTRGVREHGPGRARAGALRRPRSPRRRPDRPAARGARRPRHDRRLLPPVRGLRRPPRARADGRARCARCSPGCTPTMPSSADGRSPTGATLASPSWRSSATATRSATPPARSGARGTRSPSSTTTTAAGARPREHGRGPSRTRRVSRPARSRSSRRRSRTRQPRKPGVAPRERPRCGSIAVTLQPSGSTSPAAHRGSPSFFVPVHDAATCAAVS
jgi:hypothetical protein